MSQNKVDRPKEWYGRGYLPHYDDGYSTQSLTFRLSDSMPQSLLDKWRAELAGNNHDWEVEYKKRVEQYLDRGHGECFLRREAIADMVRDSLFHHDGEKYNLHAWVIMPNHLHLMLDQAPGVSLEEIEHSIKSYTAHEANKLLGRQGAFWQRECFDRFIRDRQHFVSALRYIESNPVKAGLCLKPEDWVYSSAFWRQR